LTHAYPGLALFEVPALRLQDLGGMDSPWSYRRLGLFCKLDVQLERGLRLPVLIRLGDAQRVDAMEGKGPLREIPLH
jgi:hypothetical protein